MYTSLLVLSLLGCDPGDANADGDNDGFTVEQGDCNDAQPAINPLATDQVGDGIDQNCEGVDGHDGDLDGFADIVSGGNDCDDHNKDVNPSEVEVCNELDDDCSGFVDDDAVDAPTWYNDADGDGYGQTFWVEIACVAPEGFISMSGDDGDCEYNPDAYPGVLEVCDGIDNDCNGIADDNASDAAVWFEDSDGDGFGNLNSTLVSCGTWTGGDGLPSRLEAPEGYSENNTDCDDTHSEVYPVGPVTPNGVTPAGFELCDGLDNDCDGTIDGTVAFDGSVFPGWGAEQYCQDFDSDGCILRSSSEPSCYVACPNLPQIEGYVPVRAANPNGTFTYREEDCDDTDPTIHSLIVYLDYDNDGYGAGPAQVGCPNYGGVLLNGDCNDSVGIEGYYTHPGAPEVCDAKDNDCNGFIDDGIVCSG